MQHSTGRRSRGWLERSARVRAAALLCLLAGLSACGSEAPEAQLAEAREHAAERREQVAELETKVEEKREVVRRAKEALARARTELEEAEAQLASAREQVDATATDVALFRAVQSALLEHDALEDFAIRVDVEAGVVTLRGRVADSSQAEAALECARSVAGVDQVVDEIRVREQTRA